ncbi:MAG TPA: hypothetical protein VEL31_01755 [Ktedonobacteraceae bacterium]|nr:hypothetical protein [Ktedonobacteraceae bacterium]
MVESIEVFCQRVAQGLADATFEQKRQLIELLVDRVVVTGNEVEIRYVIPTSKSSEQIRFCHLRLDYFDIPMLSIQFQETPGISMFPGYTSNTINSLYSLFLLFFYRFSYHKDLCNTDPLFLEPFVHLRTRPNFPHL